jgi:hypothetical protein
MGDNICICINIKKNSSNVPGDVFHLVLEWSPLALLLSPYTAEEVAQVKAEVA